MGLAAGQPGPQRCLMVELKVAPVLHTQETWLLLPPSQQTSLVPSCGIPSSSCLLVQNEEWGLILKKESKSQRYGTPPKRGTDMQQPKHYQSLQ